MSPNPEAQRPREISQDDSKDTPQLPIEMQPIPIFTKDTSDSLPHFTVFAAGEPGDDPVPPQGFPGPGVGFPPGAGGFGPRQIDNTEAWRGMLDTPNAANMMRSLGPSAVEYLKTLDANSPLRLNSVPMFMNTADDANRQKIMGTIKDSLQKGLPPMQGPFGEDAESDPTEAHRRQALRFMLTADAKIRLDRIAMAQKAGGRLDAGQQEEVKKIVTNLLHEEGEVLKPFDDFLNGFNDGPLRVKVEGDTRFGLSADACSIRELANREKTKNMILSLEKAGNGSGPGGNAVGPEDVAETLDRLRLMATEDPPSASAKAFIEKLASAGVNVPQMISDLRNSDKSISEAARKEFVRHLPEMKYGAFSPAQICKSIPPELLKSIVKDEEKRALDASKLLTDPLKAFCAGQDGKPPTADERKRLIAAANEASTKQGIGADAVSWMKLTDAQIAFKDAKSPAEAMRTLRQVRNLVDAEQNRHAATFLSNLPELAKGIGQKLKIEGDVLEKLSTVGDPDAEKILKELQSAVGDRLKNDLAEKGARAVLADSRPGEGTDVITKRIGELERFGANSPFAKDRLDFLKTENAVLTIRTSGGDKVKVEIAVNSLLDQSNANNKYAKAIMMEMLVDGNHTSALNGQETEEGVQQLVPSYKTKLEDVLKTDDPTNAPLVKDIRRRMAENIIAGDLQKPSERQVAILSLVSAGTDRKIDSTFGDKTIGEKLAVKLKQTATTAPVENLERISNGLMRSIKLNNEAHPHRIADAYLTCVERGGIPADTLRNQYASATDMASSGKKEAVRIVAGMIFKSEAQDCQRLIGDKRVGNPATELKALYTKYSTGPDASKDMKEHIQQSVKEFSERPVQAMEKRYPGMMTQLMASRNNDDLRPKENVSQNLAYGHNVLADLYGHLKLEDQSKYHSAQTAEILRAEASLKKAPKAIESSGDIVKSLVEEMMALTSKLSIEADHAKFKVGVADRFLLDCLEKCPGLRIPASVREGASTFKGFELNGDDFKFAGKASLALRANDAGIGLLGVDKLVNVHLDNTSAKIKVDPQLDKLTLSDIKGAKLTLDKSAGDMLMQKLKDFPADKQPMIQLFAAMVKTGQSPEIEAKSIDVHLEKQENGEDVLNLNLTMKVLGMEQVLSERIAIPREQANQVRALLAELRLSPDKRDVTKYLQAFISAGLDDRINNFIGKFDSFQKLDDGSFKCTRKEEGEFDLGNLKLLVGKTLQAKPARGEDCSSITNIEGLSAKIPLPAELAEKLKIKDAVNIKALHIGDLKDGKRKITIETDSLYKKIEIELDQKFELVKDGNGNITVNAKLAKDNNELDLVCRFNPQSLQNGKLLNSTWSFDVKGSSELKQELLGDFLKELSPLAGKIETISNNPRETKLVLTEPMKFDVKGVQLSFDKEISLERPAGVRPDGGFSATVKGVDISKFGGGTLHRFVYGSKSLLKPEAIDWTPGKNGAEGKLIITPSKKSAVTAASVDVNSDTLKPTAAEVTIDNPLEAATSPGSHTWTSVTAKLKADGNGDLQVDNMTEIVANLALKTAAMHLLRPIRLISTGVKALISLFD